MACAPVFSGACPAKAVRAPGYELVQGTSIFGFSWGKMKYVVNVEEGAECYNTPLAAVQPHTHAWRNTHFQVNCFLDWSIPLENCNNWMCAEDASRQQKSGRGIKRCTARVWKGDVSELESKIWLWELALQSCRWSLSFRTETGVVFCQKPVFHLSKWEDYYFSSLEIQILANFWLPKNKLQLLSFLICLQYFSSF